MSSISRSSSLNDSSHRSLNSPGRTSGTVTIDGEFVAPVRNTSSTQPQAMSMSAVEMRGSIAGMELLRAQNTQLQNENDNLKRLLSQSERDREQDISYMRALLGRRLCRSHAQSFKLRRLLIKLHAQVLDIARVINIEQRTSEMAENMVLSVQDQESGTQAEADLAQEQRIQFLSSLQRLRPARVSTALQENLERLFENMNEIIRRCPKYRMELNSSFARSIQLKESLLTSEGKYERARQRGEEMEAAMVALSEETSMYRKKNEQLARDMRLTLDIERRRRLRENQQYIKARTSLYKKILADKDSPMHPAARTGKHSNLLGYTPSPQSIQQQQQQQQQQQLSPQQKSSTAQDAQSAAQHAYYLERRAAQALAQAQADNNYDGMNDDDRRAAYDAYLSAGVPNDSDTVYLADDSILPVDGTTFDPTVVHDLPGDAAMAGADRHDGADEREWQRAMEEAEDEKDQQELDQRYQQMQLELQRQEHEERRSRDERAHKYESKDQSTALPPIQSRNLSNSASSPTLSPGSSLKAAYSNPFWSPIRPKPSATYTAAVKAEVAYRNSPEWNRAQATAHTNSRLREAGLERSPPALARRDSLMHPTHSSSFGAAQRMYTHAHVYSHGSTIDPNGWNENFNSTNASSSSSSSNQQQQPSPSQQQQQQPSSSSKKASTASPVTPQSPGFTRALLALDDVRTQSTHAAATANVHDNLLALRSSFTLTPDNKKDRAAKKVSRDMAFEDATAILSSAKSPNASGVGVDGTSSTSPNRTRVRSTSPNQRSPHRTTHKHANEHMSTSEWVESMLAESGTGSAGGGNTSIASRETTVTTSTSTTSSLRFHHGTSPQPHATMTFKSKTMMAQAKRGQQQQNAASATTSKEPIVHMRTIPSPRDLENGFF